MYDIPLPNDINKAIIVLNPILLGIVLSYDYVSADSINPLLFLLICIFSMFFAFCMWGQKRTIINDFNKRFGNYLNSDWHWYHSSYNYPNRVEHTYMMSVISFLALWAFAIALQAKSIS
jgi:hypothetical protein